MPPDQPPSLLMNLPSAMDTSPPTMPGKASGLPVGRSRYDSAFSASCAYLPSPERSLRRVHSRMRVPTSAMLLDDELPCRRVGFRYTVGCGTPLVVLNAMLRLSARLLAWSSRFCTLAASLTSPPKGPLSRS